MNLNLQKAKEILSTYNQEHLLNFYDYLNDEQKAYLLEQINTINFEQIFKLYENSKIESDTSNDIIEPLPCLDKNSLTQEQIDYYTNIGIQSIKNNEYAVITMAGGQGTRLGFKGPKGTFELDLTPVKSLFEIACDALLKAKELYNVTIPWYIMTSYDNDSATKEFFENHNYFNYGKENIKFFKQNKLPLIDVNCNLMLQETYMIKEASNGNGDIFSSFNKSGFLNELIEKNYKWIFIGGIDNVLLKNVDPFFIGVAIDKKVDVISKTIFKENPSDKVCVFGMVNKKTSIIDYNILTDEMSLLTDDAGNYLYRDENILSHLLSVSAFKKIVDKDLPYHRAFKKNTFVNYEGMKEVPNKPNSFKFEKFIFDGFAYLKPMQLLRINRNEEFAPIKDFTGIYSPETAKSAYEQYFGIVNHKISHTKKL